MIHHKGEMIAFGLLALASLWAFWNGHEMGYTARWTPWVKGHTHRKTEPRMFWFSQAMNLLATACLAAASLYFAFKA